MTMHPNSLKNLRPWPAGQSGNPEGRPPGSCKLATIIDRIMDACDGLPEKLAEALDDETATELMAAVLEYSKTNVSMMALVFERIDGPVDGVLKREHAEHVDEIMTVVQSHTDEATFAVICNQLFPQDPED